MTFAQWYFEAMALAHKERQEEKRLQDYISNSFKSYFRSLHESLIRILGLAVGKSKEEGGFTPFIPLSHVVAKPEVVEQLKKLGDVENATQDEGLDTLNEQLAELDIGDLEPILFGDTDVLDSWFSPENEALLRALGVEMASDQEGVERVEE